MDCIWFLKILVCKLKFNIFTISESIWRVFFLRPNYRHNSDMISVDRICILEILDHVRLKFVVFTIRKMIWRVFLRWTNYWHYSNMINVNCISVCMNLVNVKLKSVIFSIRELIWRVFLLWTNYRHYSNMINVDCILISKILVHVRFGLINLMFSQFMTMFGAISVFNRIIDTILVWSMWFCFLFSKFLFVLSLVW